MDCWIAYSKYVGCFVCDVQMALVCDVQMYFLLAKHNASGEM